MIHAPSECSLQISPCEMCGGTVEVVRHDSNEIEQLSKALKNLDKSEDELRIIIATQVDLVATKSY